VVLFFTKGEPTLKTWFYQLDPGRSLGKGNPLNDDDLAEFVALQATKADSAKSWTLSIADIDTTTYDLSVKNPTAQEVVALRDPDDILDELVSLDAQTAEIMQSIRGLLA
jgi:type I restriction enzyme M protein